MQLICRLVAGYLSGLDDKQLNPGNLVNHDMCRCTDFTLMSGVIWHVDRDGKNYPDPHVSLTFGAVLC